MKRAIIVSVVACLAALAACSDLFDQAVQCKTARDCERFQAQCDLAQGICVPFGTLPGDEAGVLDGPDPIVDASPDQAAVNPACEVSPKPTAPIPSTATADAGDSEISSSVTLDCTKDWILKDRVFVKSGATLTIEPGTTIRADANAAIVVRPGAQIIARGLRDRPIVMVPNKPADPQPGDWRGLLVFGAAPPTGTFANDANYAWGGAAADDDSGVLEFVRIEYAALGLVLAGVGNGTAIDHVEVRKSGDNCFSVQGGRFDAKHLVCQYPTDEMYEIGSGYQGRLQFLYGQKVPLAAVGNGRHGLLVEGNAFPRIYNATLCGDDQPSLSYGLVFRNNGRLDLNSTILSGWLSGFDAVGALGTPISLRGSIVAGNAENPAYVETEGGAGETADDDNGFDEIAFFGDGGTNKTTSAGLVACYDAKNPQPWPAAMLAGGPTPPNDGFFDSTATYIGAFRDGTDDWMKGAWARFDDK